MNSTHRITECSRLRAVRPFASTACGGGANTTNVIRKRIKAMSRITVIILFLIFQMSCNNPFSSDDDREYTLNVGQLVLPDTARIFQPMQIKVEVTLISSNHSYVGPILESTSEGYRITLIGKAEDVGDMKIQPVVWNEWHSFNLIPFRKGQVIIEGVRVKTDNIVDSVYVK